MTPRRRECYDFILEFWEKRRYGPTYHEIAEGVGLLNRAAARRMVKLLERDGWVTTTPKSPRSVKPVNLR